MLELDGSILVVMIMFAVLAWAVSRIYLRPLGELLEQRQRSTRGTLDAAQSKMAQVEGQLRRYDQLIQEARAATYRQQEEQRRLALDKRQELLRDGRTQYERILAEARREISAQTERAKEWMAREASSFSSEIVRKLLA